MTPSDFQFIQNFIKEASGIVLSEGKEYLLDSRLMPVARAQGLDSISALVTVLKNPENLEIRNTAIEAMTTNESFFFRDKTPFVHFEEAMVPAFLESRAAQKRLRIWCAAASSGQEPYSLAMSIKEMPEKLATWNIEIIGTDLSKQILEKAKAGLYSQFEVQRGLPIQLLVKYFKQVGEMWQIDAALRGMVKYRPFNLLENFASLGQFDIVYCRNVLIYFDEATKRDVLERIAERLAPDGYLVLGAAETVIGITDVFTSCRDRRGLYQINPERSQSTAAGSGTLAASHLRAV